MKAQELASKEFCILCHDDNLIHPQFFERMLLGLNSIKDVAGIACSYDLFYTDLNVVKDPFKDIQQNLKSSTELNKSFLIYENWFDFCRNNILAETYPWPKISPGLPVLIYKTDILKHSVDMEPLYAKASDIPLYYDILKKGKFVLLLDVNALVIRQHTQRDFYLDDNGLSLKQLINWLSIYTNELNKYICGDLWLHFWGMVYNLYPILAKKSFFAEYDFKRFCSYLIEKNIVSKEGENYYPLFMDTVAPSVPFTNRDPSFWERIFSVRNEWRSNGKKRKVLRLLGLKVCLGVTRIQNNTIPKTLQNDMISTYDALMVSDIAKNNTIDIQRENFDHVHLSLSSVGNTVVIEKNPSIGQIHIKITGKNHSIRLGDLSSVIGTLNIQADGVNTTTNIGNVYVGSYLNILNGKKIKDQSSRNTQIYIGNGSSFEGCQICSFHTGTSVSIGEKCMFSGGIYVMASDTHPIYDYETKKIINKAYHGVTIGNHCWIGSGATILKDAVIPDDCIIGWNAVVTKSFDEPHCAIAGIPAKIVKHGVTWDFEDENLFI